MCDTLSRKPPFHAENRAALYLSELQQGVAQPFTCSVGTALQPPRPCFLTTHGALLRRDILLKLRLQKFGSGYPMYLNLLGRKMCHHYH